MSHSVHGRRSGFSYMCAVVLYLVAAGDLHLELLVPWLARYCVAVRQAGHKQADTKASGKRASECAVGVGVAASGASSNLTQDLAGGLPLPQTAMVQQQQSTTL